MENNFKHTPAPWRYVGHDPVIQIITEPQIPGIASSYYIIGEALGGIPTEDGSAEANAKLIAAAPELLESLQMALPVLSEYSSKAYFAAQEAIKKATE